MSLQRKAGVCRNRAKTSGRCRHHTLHVHATNSPCSQMTGKGRQKFCRAGEISCEIEKRSQRAPNSRRSRHVRRSQKELISSNGDARRAAARIWAEISLRRDAVPTNVGRARFDRSRVLPHSGRKGRRGPRPSDHRLRPPPSGREKPAVGGQYVADDIGRRVRQ